MALNETKLLALLDQLDTAAASPALEVTTGDGKHIRFDSLEEIQRRRAHIMALLGAKGRKGVSYVALKDG